MIYKWNSHYYSKMRVNYSEWISMSKCVKDAYGVNTLFCIQFWICFEWIQGLYHIGYLVSVSE